MASEDCQAETKKRPPSRTKKLAMWQWCQGQGEPFEINSDQSPGTGLVVTTHSKQRGGYKPLALAGDLGIDFSVDV
jgi:hypothetical protein